MKKLFDKVTRQEQLAQSEIIELLQIDVTSEDFYTLLSIANAYSRKKFNNEGHVFGQIGIDVRKCSGNCKFCMLAKDTLSTDELKQKSLEEVLELAQKLVTSGAEEVFLMTTADYPIRRYLEVARKVREMLPSTVRMIGNIGDFNIEVASQLKEVGFSGIYHICRLKEGVDTDIDVNVRIATLEAIKAAKLDLYYCVEPIGPEHTYEEIAEEILRATRYPVTVMAAMRRVAVPGTLLAEKGEISSAELAKIVAVTLLVVRPDRAMGVHEPIEMCLMAGANQIYAEIGTNPRDTAENTESGRGFSVDKAKEMLRRAEWKK